MKIELEILYNKFLRHELSPAEEDHLEFLLQDPENFQAFKEQIEIEFLINSQHKGFKSRSGFSNIRKSIEGRENFNWKPLLKYAAVLVILFGTIFLFWNRTAVIDTSDFPVVIIESESGDVETLEVKGERQIINKRGQVIATKNANLITYKSDSTATKLEYHTIKVPNGTLIEMVLSDGTKVDLNAGSQLRYPVQFIKGKDRQVYLKGEGYFNVTEDSLHPFKVNTRNFDISVLGTEFNVSAYEDYPFSFAVVVEGLVRVGNSTSEELLSSGEIANIDNSESPIEVQKVNIKKYIAWREGITILQNQNFRHIMKTLERKFDVTFQNNYPELEQENFTATLVDEDLKQVLDLFSKSRPFKYEINDKKVTIDKK